MKLKSLLPFDRYTVVTKLNVAEVMRRLEENVAPKKTVSNLVVTRFTPKETYDKPYAGTIRGQQFEISRVITYKNSFLPVIKGEVSHFLGQTEVKIKSSPHVAVLVFSAFWMSMVLLGCIGVTVAGFSEGFELTMLIPFAMLVFGSLLFTIPYKLEAKKSRDFLAKLLEGEEIKEV